MIYSKNQQIMKFAKIKSCEISKRVKTLKVVNLVTVMQLNVIQYAKRCDAYSINETLQKWVCLYL